MILHTVNKSPLTHRSLASCMQFIGESDGLLLLEDGVYAALHDVCSADMSKATKIYAIAADVEARGLKDRLVEHISVIDYREFVNLCTQFDVVKNWS
jgi:tRNA 2-thiouridine synthesizing protein B